MKHILVGINYSDLTAVTLKYSLKLAQYFGAKLTVVHVAKYPKELEGDAKKIKAHQTAKTEELEAIFSSFNGKQFHNISVDLRVAFGSPSDELIRLTTALKPDLLVIGVSEHKYWINPRYTNRPMEIAESVNCPVLLVPHTGTFYNIKQIAFVTNFSLEDVGALTELSEWATIFKSKIHCIHICKTEKNLADANRKMNILKKIFVTENFEFSVTVGKEVDNLKNFLKADKANLVVLLKRNKTLWYDTVKPSLTKKIAEETWIPLLIYNQQ